MKHYVVIILLYIGCVSHDAWAVSEGDKVAEKPNMTEVMLNDGKLRARIYKKERLFEFADIDPTTNKLVLQADCSLYKDQVSVVRFHIRPKALGGGSYSMSLFDTQMKPTLRHGYHKWYYQYSSLFTKLKTSKSFVDTKEQPTTIYGNVATCQYVYVPLFNGLFFIYFLDKTGQQVDLNYKGVKIRAILYDLSDKKDADIKDLFKQNTPISYYCTEGNPNLLRNLDSVSHQMFLLDIL